jgi:hypothetical protein
LDKGGITTVSLQNGTTILAAAYGGDGGGDHSYCTALGGLGASLRDEPKEIGGYINFDFASSSSDDTNEVDRVESPGEPMIERLSHDSATFTWSAGSNQRSKELYVQKYIVQLAEGNIGNEDADDQVLCSNDDYELHEHIQRSFDVNQNATTTLLHLDPSTSYCLHVEAISIEGLGLGVQIISFTTTPTPVNEWIPVTVRQSEVSNLHEEINGSSSDQSTASSWCEHSSSRPTGRRGHTMTVVNDNVYIFGGATMKCICDYDEAGIKQCSSKNVYSDELWHFDPVTSMFTQLEREAEDDPWPQGREMHSATALRDGSIVFIGGVTGTDNNAEIGEDSVWRLNDPHHISTHVFQSTDVTNEKMPLELVPGHIASNEIFVPLDDEDTVNEMCIHDIQVKVSLDLSCLKGIEYIKLTGPGTKDTAVHDAPQSAVYETKVRRKHVCYMFHL